MVHTRSASIRCGTLALLAGGLFVLGSACSTPSATSTSSAGATASASSGGPACAEGARMDPTSGACVAEAAEGGAPEVSPGGTASAAASAARPAPRCPEASNPDKVAAFDWGKELGVDAPLGVQLRGTSGTAIEVRLLANQIESELRTECAAMATELGGKGPYVSSQTACQAALDGLHTTRAKLGPGTKVAIRVHPALCPESVEMVQSCAKRCSGDDATPTATCSGATAGKCPGACDGACEMRPATTCDGTCLGQCESAFTGTCAGTCKGKCDGKAMAAPGECKGKCEGGCDSVGKGECKGKCLGGCQLKASACSGVCTGKCSVPLEDLRCMGTVKLAATGPACAAYCDMQSIHRMTCGSAQVDARASGAKDAAAATAYVSAVEKHLPAILNIEQKLKGRMDEVGKTKGVVADGLKAINESGSPALPALTACLGSYDKATSEGVASLLAASRSASQVASTAQGK
jgi:hypothetical protein